MDKVRAEKAVRELLLALDQNIESEGLKDTPRRVAEMFIDQCQGKPAELDRVFEDHFEGMVIVRDIPFVSCCVHGDTLLRGVDGAKRARHLSVGEKLATFDGHRAVETAITGIRKVEVERRLWIHTDRTTVCCTTEHPFLTPQGYIQALHLKPGDELVWWNPKTLYRKDFPIVQGYSLGYVLGALASDGSVSEEFQERKCGIEVISKAFTEKYQYHFEQAFGKRLEIASYLRGGEFRAEPVQTYRIQCSDIGVIRYVQQLIGEDKRTIPLVDAPTLCGYLDGFLDGDGSYNRCITQEDEGLIRRLASLWNGEVWRSGQTCWGTHVPTNFSNRLMGLPVYRSDPRGGWNEKLPADVTFLGLPELRLFDAEIAKVTDMEVEYKKSYGKMLTMYDFECSPYPSYLTQGLASKNCEHHMVFYSGRAHIAYIPKGKVIGISKLARLVAHCSTGFTIQEKVSEDIASRIFNEIEGVLGCMVVIEAEHGCMNLRGARATGSSTVTSVVKGVFRDVPAARAEFMGLVSKGGPR